MASVRRHITLPVVLDRKLLEMAQADGISAAAVVRQLVSREWERRDAALNPVDPFGEVASRKEADGGK